MGWQTEIEILKVASPMLDMHGEILLRSGVAAKMYDAMVKWL